MDLKKFEEAKQAQEEYKQEKKRIIDENLELPGLVDVDKRYKYTTKLLKGISFFEGVHIHMLNQENVETPKNRPIIFANTHRFKPDFEKISQKTNHPSFVVASDFINSYKTISGWYFNTRPTIFVDPYSEEDKAYTYQMMVRYLKAGLDGMIFPEAVWNLEPEKLLLDTFYGTVRAALETNAVIVCTAIERYGKKGRNYVINRNGYFDPSEILKKYTNLPFSIIQKNWMKEDWLAIVDECNVILRDTLATLLMEIWINHSEEYGLEKRADIKEDYWEKYIEKTIKEWKGYKLQDNIEQRFQNKKELEYYQVQQDFANLRRKLHKDNLFLFASEDRYQKYLITIDELEGKRLRKVMMK